MFFLQFSVSISTLAWQPCVLFRIPLLKLILLWHFAGRSESARGSQHWEGRRRRERGKGMERERSGREEERRLCFFLQNCPKIVQNLPKCTQNWVQSHFECLLGAIWSTGPKKASIFELPGAILVSFLYPPALENRHQKRCFFLKHFCNLFSLFFRCFLEFFAWFLDVFWSFFWLCSKKGRHAFRIGFYHADWGSGLSKSN